MIRFEKSLSVRPVFAALALAGLFWAVCVLSFDFNGLYTPDSAEFSILAKSIASGMGYRDISQPYFPFHTKYPFGYPVLLAPAAFLFGSSGPAFILACKAVTALFGALTLLGVYFFFRHYLSTRLLFTLLLLCAANPVSLLYSSNVMSEIPLSCVSIWALILIRYLDAGISLESVRETVREVGRSPIVVAGLLWLMFLMALPIAASYYVRGNGIVLLPAAAAYFFVKKSSDPLWFRASKSLALACFVTLLVLPWVYRDVNLSRGGQTSGENYVSQILTPFENPFRKKLDSAMLAHRVGTNAQYYAQVVLGHLFPVGNEKFSGVHSFASSLGLTSRASGFLSAVCGFVAACILLGLWFHLRKHRTDLAFFYVVFFIGLLLVFTYRQHRYLIPLLPFSYYFMLTGMSRLSSVLKGSGDSTPGPLQKTVSAIWKPAAIAAASAVFALNSASCYMTIRNAAGGEVETLQIASFVDSASPRDAVVSAGPYHYLFSNRLCVPFDPKSMSLEGFDTHILMYGVQIILSEKWSDQISDFDLLMQSSLSYEFEKLGSIGGMDVYKVKKRDESKFISKKKQADFGAIIKNLEGRHLEHNVDLNSWNLLGYAYYQKDDYLKAIKCFKVVVAMNPHDHVARLNLGAAYMGNKNYDEAMEQFEAARNTEFGYTVQSVLNRNILILRKMQVIDEDPRSAGIETMHMDIAQLWFDSGVYKKAIREIEAAIKANPEWIYPKFFLGLNYEAMGESKKALAVYEAILKKYPADKNAREKIKYLKSRK